MSKIKSITIADNEEFLRQKSKNVDFCDPSLLDDIAVLEKFCKENSVMAMAAVQLGIPKRIVYLKKTDIEIIRKEQFDSATKEEENYNEAKVLINPVITLKEGLTTYWEACASCLDNMGLVKRPYRIVVEYFDIDGKFHKDIVEGFRSTVLSHEIDHLDGILHIDIAEKVLVMNSNKRKKFRQTHDYEIISKEGDFLKLKNEI